MTFCSTRSERPILTTNSCLESLEHNRKVPYHCWNERITTLTRTTTSLIASSLCMPLRLLNVHTLEFKEFPGVSKPPYITLSHRCTDDEISYKDFLKKRNTYRPEYDKIIAFCKFVKAQRFWVSPRCLSKREEQWSTSGSIPCVSTAEAVQSSKKR